MHHACRCCDRALNQCTTHVYLAALQTSGPGGQEAAVGAVSNLACIRTHQQLILEVSWLPWMASCFVC